MTCRGLGPVLLREPDAGKATMFFVPLGVFMQALPRVLRCGVGCRQRRGSRLPVASVLSPVPRAPEVPDRFHPAEDFLDPFSNPLRDKISRISARPVVER